MLTIGPVLGIWLINSQKWKGGLFTFDCSLIPWFSVSTVGPELSEKTTTKQTHFQFRSGYCLNGIYKMLNKTYT